jgi:hypothetical protein
MTVAIDFADLVEFVPVRRPLAPVPDRMPAPGPERHPRHCDTPVVRLLPPSEASVAAPLRLTRRGVAVVAGLVVALAAVLIGLAWAGDSAPTPAASVSQAVTVGPGDTLWSIAGRVAPDRDPRAEVADLQRINHLGSADLTPGQLLRTTG